MPKNIDQLEVADLKGERVPAPSTSTSPTAAELSRIAGEQLGQKLTVSALEMRLTARHPYDPAGLMDFYQPGRWDTTYNLIYMSSDFASDSASAGYGQFTAQAAGQRLTESKRRSSPGCENHRVTQGWLPRETARWWRTRAGLGGTWD